MNGTPITSAKNPIFLLQQKVLKLKKTRRKEGLIWLEGLRAVQQCPPSKIKALFLGSRAPEGENWPCAPYRLSEELASLAFDTESPQEVGCLLNWRGHDLEDLNWEKGVVIADGLQDPGNAGSLLRSAAGLDYGGFVMLDSIELGNPKLLRSCAGHIFSIPLCESDSRETLQAYLSDNNIACYMADAGGENDQIKKPEGPFCLVIGSEGHGLGPGWTGQRWTLPLANDVESLNAAVAGSLLAYCLKI